MSMLFSFVFALLAQLSLCYIKMPVLTAAGEIWDLYAYNDIRDILALGEDWLVVPYIHYPRKKVSFCNSWYFLGGPGISSSVGYFERTYTDLPTHDLVYYSIPVQLINTWDLTDSFSIIIDGVTLSTWTTATYPAADCSSVNLVQSVGGKVLHSASTLTLKIAFNIYSSNASPASLIVKDVYFSFRSSTTEAALVVDWLTYGCPASSPACSCTSNCQVCFGSGTTECARCFWGSSDSGSGCGSCTTNCVMCSGSANNECTLCNVGYTLTLDGTCSISCPTDSVTMANGRYSLCISPCPTGQYMMWNWTCGTSCDFPLTQTASTPTTYCNYPCDQENGQYLYWNGTCSSSCAYKTRNESWYYFCDACPEGYWYYQNGSCLSACQKNFDKTTVGGSDFCTYPCASSEYLYPNGSCLSTCQKYWDTRIEGTFQLCDYPCKTGYWLASDGTCDTTSSLSNGTKSVLSGSQKTSSVLTQTASFLTSGSGITISASFAGRIFFNIKYMNISYSEELEEALKTWSQSFISDDLTPDLPQSVIKKIPSRHVPYMFAKYSVASSFLINYWESLGMIILVFLAVILAITIELLIKFFNKHQTYVGIVIMKLKIITQNFLIATLYGVYGDLVMYAILEYRSIKFKRDLSLLSFILSVTLLFIMFTGFILHFLLLKKYQNAKKRIDKGPSQVLENFSKGYPGLQTLYRDFTDRSLERQAFLLTLTIRDIIFSLVICTLFDYPFIQAMIFCMNSFFTVVYLIDRKPFREKFDLAQQTFFEMIGLVVNISVLINSVQDDNHENTDRVIVDIGKFVIAMNMIYNFSLAILMFVQILLIIREQWQAYKLKRKSKVSPQIKILPALNESSSNASLRNSEPTLSISHEPIQTSFEICERRSFNDEENEFQLIHSKDFKSISTTKRRRIR